MMMGFFGDRARPGSPSSGLFGKFLGHSPSFFARERSWTPQRLHRRNVLKLRMPDLDHWLPKPSMRVAHRRESDAPPERLWEAARTVRLADARKLGRLVRWRIPDLAPDLAFDAMFRAPPFIVLAEENERGLVSGLVGRIWTLRRDYPRLTDPEEFREWSTGGTARVLFANWIEQTPSGRAALQSEVRVEAIGVQGRVGVAAVRPLVGAFGNLIGSDGIEAAVRIAERR
jgi:hypothetical protein